MPSVVTGAFAASFVAAMGTANLGGRFLSALTSDKLANMTVGALLCLSSRHFSHFVCNVVWLKKAFSVSYAPRLRDCGRLRCRCCVPPARIHFTVSIWIYDHIANVSSHCSIFGFRSAHGVGAVAGRSATVLRRRGLGRAQRVDCHVRIRHDDFPRSDIQ